MNGVWSRERLAELRRWDPPQVGDSPPPPEPEPEPAPRPTVSDLEALERQAREEGYAAGLAEGREAARQQLDERLARLDALCAAAARPLDALDDAVEQELARLAVVVARRVLDHELKLAPERIALAVHRAVGMLPSASRSLGVRLHPDDLALLRELGAAEAHWQLIPDPALARGDCLLESGSSRLDARVETRLAAVVEAVLGEEPGEDGPA
jgi:flagellar assembly protein FliH